MVDVAARRTVQLRQQFTDPPAVARHLTTTTNPQINTPWRNYHLGVAAGLSGDTALARQAFAQTTAFTDDGGGAGELAQRAGKLADLLDDAQEFRNTIGDIIQATRQRLNLPPAGPTPWTPPDSRGNPKT